MLTLFGRELSGAPSETMLVNAVLQLQPAIKEGTIQLDELSEDAVPEEAALNGRAIKLLLKLSLILTQEWSEASLREGSLHAWVMKPLVSAASMKEGSRNEIEVLKAIPVFMRNAKGAFARQRGVFDAVQY